MRNISLSKFRLGGNEYAVSCPNTLFLPGIILHVLTELAHPVCISTL